MKTDTDPEKWEMKGQTEVKHDILSKYLTPWLNKITETSDTIRYIDGFAGKGRYNDGSPGSPLIAISAANERIGSLGPKLKEFRCTFVENKSENFENLEAEVSSIGEELSGKIAVDLQKRDFEDLAQEYIKTDGGQYPAFIFIDPFGFSGLPFHTVKNLINLRTIGIEIFITFMSGKMAQFMENPDHQVAIDNILGRDDWDRQITPTLSKEERAEEFVRLYESQLRDVAEVKYVWPFQMKEEGKRQTSYYLVHATNHFDGFKLMKDIMFNAGAEDQFGYLGPDHYPYIQEQHSLGDFDETTVDKRVEELAVFLRDRYAGKPKRTLQQIMEETYEETPLIEKHYRKAGKMMRDQGLAKISNHPDRRYGRSEPAFGKQDEIEFYEGGLQDYLS